jgi:hypothetical protein
VLVIEAGEVYMFRFNDMHDLAAHLETLCRSLMT